jgi:gliding motility-associated lipoprotein GldH
LKQATKIVVSLSLLLGIITSVGCDTSRVYEEWKDMENGYWAEDSTYSFSFDIEDSTSVYNIVFGVRNSNLYPYQNLWVLTSVEGPNNLSLQDTVQFTLAKNDGEWYGKSSARLYTFTTPLYSNIRFINNGNYEITLKHGMRKEELKGINNLGLRVEKAE